MRSLRDLLTTWETWSARNTTTTALARATTDDAREVLRRSLDHGETVDPLDALEAGHELATLLTGWRWQAVHAARRDGATWEQIGRATGTTGEQARADYLAAIERQEHYGISDVSAYREVL